MITIIRSLFFNVVFFTTIAAALILGIPLMLVENRRRVFAFWHYLSVVLGFITEKIGGIKYVIENKKNILKEPAIYAIRHESVWETLVLINKFKYPIFILKKELIRIPLFGTMSLRAGTIVIDRKNGIKSLAEAAKKVDCAIKEGCSVIIFPEGTRMASGVFSPLKRGVALFYKNVACPVVPVVHNSGKFWPRRGFIKKPGTITLTFRDPISPGLSTDEFMDRLNEIFADEVERLKFL
ncbi:MAG: 1-acyl-sn-glycerol-3-phosphate acyltransferase [Holosporaceae bacterium]|jgi:1-acyl-sn-glycerol-3-phosphate acyltransferase|nr:1-acyl-sn-glycerol-3-phosphate acyltransferase [Holosporaceae bacterium]